MSIESTCELSSRCRSVNNLVGELFDSNLFSGRYPTFVILSKSKESENPRDFFQENPLQLNKMFI